MAMRTQKGLGLFLVAATGCAAAEPKRPEPEGIVVLELPSASTAATATRPSNTVVAAKSEPLDLETCIARVRQDPFPSGAPDAGGSDRYDAALAAERRSSTDTARKLYFETIQSFPKSSYLPLAYFAFGEMFRVEAATDPAKITFAEQSYAEVAKYPAPQNPLWEVAHIRMAELKAMKGEGLDVMASLKRVAETRGSSRCADGLSVAIRAMLPPAYASSGRPDRAATFFATFGSDELTALATARLASLYVSQQKKPDAVTALRGLASSKVPGNTALCSDALSVAQELGDATLVADLGAKCVNFRRP